MTEEVYTVALLNDHLGQNKPTVVGHEYCVDAIIDVSVYLDLDYDSIKI